MQAARLLVTVFSGVLALLTAVWGGWLFIAGALGRHSEDLGPAFFMAMGGALLALAGVLALLAFLTREGPTGRWQWYFTVLFALALGLALYGFVTAFWLGLFVLVGLVVTATVFQVRRAG